MKVYLQEIQARVGNTLALPSGAQFVLRKKFYFGFLFYLREARLRYLLSRASNLGILKIALQMFCFDLTKIPLKTCAFLFRASYLELAEGENLRGLCDMKIGDYEFWISRQSLLGGIHATHLDESIDYDFSRNLSNTYMRIWSTSLSPQVRLGKVPEGSQVSTVQVSIQPKNSTYSQDLFELKDARVMHGSTVIANGIVHPLFESQISSNGEWPSSKPSKLINSCVLPEASVVAHIPDGLFLGHSQSWYHFLIEVYPRYLNLPMDSRGLTVLLPKKTHASMIDCIKLLGFDSFVFIPPFQSVTVGNLHLSTPHSCGSEKDVFGFESVVNRLHKHFLQKVPYNRALHKRDKLKILIKRPNNVFRQLSNRTQMEQFLQRRGFVTVSPETMSLVDQIDLFRHAELVIGESGAALTSLVFCEPGTSVLEIQMSEDRHIDFWGSFSEMLNLRHEKILSQNKRVFMKPSKLEVDLLRLSLAVEDIVGEI